MPKPADPIVFGPEYTPVADPQSRRAAPASVTCDETASALWLHRAEGEDERLRQIAAGAQLTNYCD
ncbi:hypothetical protein OG949_23835 [Streptomyces scopuliridis]|uniref:hypothetical protein n=1 Tax=Streptomyces scopuliridis TaxID=452529 RepID=UPI002DD930F1|nr:hypothetical protein [Streptomyces scopuliridis]WSB35571.1 hypothetical protein OG949_23835 [Streptomyces scopuliridis]